MNTQTHLLYLYIPYVWSRHVPFVIPFVAGYPILSHDIPVIY